MIYRTSSIKPRGPNLISGIRDGGLLERALIREGSLFKTSKYKDVYDSFSILLPYILRVQHETSRVRYINSTLPPPQTLLKVTCKFFQRNIQKIVGNFRNLIEVGGVNREGGLFKILTQRGGAHQRRGLSHILRD